MNYKNIPHMGDNKAQKIHRILYQIKIKTLIMNLLLTSNFQKAFNVIVSLLFCSTIISSQTIITQDLIEDKIGTTYKVVLHETALDIDNQLLPIIDATGGDQIYDFTNLPFVDSTVFIESLQFVDADDPILNNENFAGSSLLWNVVFIPGSGGVMDSTMQYRYGNLDNNQWTVNGSITFVDLDLNGELDTFVQWFDPPKLEVAFPVTMSSEWHSESSLVQSFMGMEFISNVTQDSNWVEGYGEIMTPHGSAQALRIYQKSIESVPNTPIIDTQFDLFFGTQNDNLSASIVLSDMRAFYSVINQISGPTSTYEVPTLQLPDILTYPNPAVSFATTEFESKSTQAISFSLLDQQGKTIQRKIATIYPLGLNQISWEISSLPSGTYIIQMRQGQLVLASAFQKF
jgi:hypothetical protein